MLISPCSVRWSVSEKITEIRFISSVDKPMWSNFTAVRFISSVDNLIFCLMVGHWKNLIAIRFISSVG